MTSSRYRWVVLILFMLVAAVSQLLWLNYAPITTAVMQKWSVSELEASLLTLVFPAIYVLVSIPAGKLIDQKGYRFSVGLGAAVMAGFSLLRIFESSFTLALVAQAGIAIGQPFAVNGISKLVADWFDAGESAIATGLGTVGMFLGMAAGMASTPELFNAFGYQATMVVNAGIAVAVCAAWFLFARTSRGSSAAAQPQEAPMLPMLKDKVLLLLFALAALGLGFFNGLTAWLEQILAPHGFDAASSGAVGGVLIGGGILGAAAVPALSDKFKMRKPFLIGSVVLALGALVPTVTSTNHSVVMASGALLGFFFLPAFALLLDMCATVAGEAAAGSATGLLMLFGNGGGVVVILGMQAVKGDGADWSRAVMLLYVLVAMAIGLALLAPETFKSPQPAPARAAA
jgi:cyanate permease